MPGRCDGCSRVGAGFRCSRCVSAWYCSRDCQRKHRPTHAPACVDYKTTQCVGCLGGHLEGVLLPTGCRCPPSSRRLHLACAVRQAEAEAGGKHAPNAWLFCPRCKAEFSGELRRELVRKWAATEDAKDAVSTARLNAEVGCCLEEGNFDRAEEAAELMTRAAERVHGAGGYEHCMGHQAMINVAYARGKPAAELQQKCEALLAVVDDAVGRAPPEWLKPFTSLRQTTLMRLGILAEKREAFEAAERHFMRALADASAVAPGKTLRTVVARVCLGGAMVLSSRRKAAVAILKLAHADAVALVGPLHPVAAAAARNLALAMRPPEVAVNHSEVFFIA